MKKFKQCRYETEDRTKWNETWLPIQLAKVGNKIHFEEGPDVGVTFIICSVGKTTRTAKEMHDVRIERKNAFPSIEGQS